MYRLTQSDALVEFNQHRELIKALLEEGYSISHVHRTLLYEKKIAMNYQSLWRFIVKNGFPCNFKKTRKKVLYA